MLDELVTAYGNRFVVAALGVALAMGCLILVLWVLKKRSPSPFIRGGRNRLPRLQVLDAAAVDARRRLVLVRRDNIEHLIMIGGPTDLVIESRIGESDGYMAEVAEHQPQQIAPPAQARQVAETPPPPPAALPRAERPRPQAPVAAAAPPRPAPVQAAPAQAARAAAAPTPPPPAYERPQPVALAPEEDEGNSFFYDEFYDDTSEEDEIADLLEATRERVFAEREQAAAAAPQPAAYEQAPAPRQQRAPAAAPPNPAQNFSASEFERVLEEEMAMHMAAEPAAARAPTRPSAPPPAQTRPTIAPPRPVAPPLMARAADPRRPAPEQASLRPAEEKRPVPPPMPARPAPQAAARPVAAAPARPAPAQRPAPPTPSRPGTQPNLQNEIARIFGEMSTKREK